MNLLPDRREGILLAVLVVAGLAARGVYFYQFQGNPFFDFVPKSLDQTAYHEGAAAFAGGDLLAVAPGQANLFSPLYQYFLGTIYWLFGVRLTAAWTAQFLLGVASSVLTYFIARHYFPPAVGFLAGILLSFYGANWLYEGSLYREVLIEFLGAASCLSLLRLARKPTALKTVLSAVVLSLFAQARTNDFLLVPFALVFVWKAALAKKENGGKLFAAYLAVFILTALPLLVRGHAVHGKWGLYDLGGPETLLLSNTLDYPGREYLHTETYDRFTKEFPLETAPVVRFVVKTAWEHPLEILKLYLRKVFYYFNNYEVPTTYNFYLFQEFSPALKWACVPFAFLSALGLMGFVLFRVRAGRWTLPHVFFIANLLMILPFYVSSRFRLPMVPFLALFSAYALWTAYLKFREKRWAGLSAFAICLGVLIAVLKTYPLAEGKIRITDYANVGSAYLLNSHPEDDGKGLDYLLRAWDFSRSLKPGLRDPDPVLRRLSVYHFQEAQKLYAAGGRANAISALQRSIDLDYSFPEPHHFYAVVLFNDQKYLAAFLEALQSVVLEPGSPEFHAFLGTVYSHSLEDPAWAEYHWQVARGLLKGAAAHQAPPESLERLRERLVTLARPTDAVSGPGLVQMRSALRSQIQPLIHFPFDTSLPESASRWSAIQSERYWIGLYQRLVLGEEERAAEIHYQLGLLHWRESGNERAAFYYFRKARELGVNSREFSALFEGMANRRSAAPVP